MAHKTLIGGTAYNISSGKSLVSGTTYSIKGGKTLIGGTGYSINFGSGGGGEPTAMLYSDGDMVFQHGSEVASGKTLTASYTGFEDTEYTSQSSVPWNSNIGTIKNVSFINEIKPVSIARWFNNARNMTSFNWSNFNWNNVTNMYSAYANCRNLTGSPVCGNNVTSMGGAYRNCQKLTGNPVCGSKVTNMYTAYYNCTNLTGSPVCGNNVTSMSYAYYGCRNLTGSPVCGNNVTSMAYTYYNCKNLNAGTFYFYSKNVSNARNCFYGKNNSRRYNIHVPANSTTLNTFIINNTYSLVGKAITWTTTTDVNGVITRYYNATYNICIFVNTSM